MSALQIIVVGVGIIGDSIIVDTYVYIKCYHVCHNDVIV